jgi:septation ring formation regulator EzrA
MRFSILGIGNKDKKLNELLEAYFDVLDLNTKRLINIRNLLDTSITKLDRLLQQAKELSAELDSSIDSSIEEEEDETSPTVLKRSDIRLRESVAVIYDQYRKLKSQLKSLSIPAIAIEVPLVTDKKLKIEKKISAIVGVKIVGHDQVCQELAGSHANQNIASMFEKFKLQVREYNSILKEAALFPDKMNQLNSKKSLLKNEFRHINSTFGLSNKQGPIVKLGNFFDFPGGHAKVAPMPQSTTEKLSDLKKGRKGSK